MRKMLLAMLSLALCGAAPQATQPHDTSRFFAADELAAQRMVERKLNALADAKRLREWHDLLASEPHIAGTPADERTIDAIARVCRDMGLSVQVHDFWALLCEPLAAELEIISPEESPHPIAASQPQAPHGRRGVIALPLTEDNLLADPFIAHPGLTFGWNAYSGSGEVTAEVVYANYGTRQDFQMLRELGVDCTGKIVLARYGGNYRGFKAKYAEQAGAAGLIIFTDPADSGSGKGPTYPDGGWANDTCIQRGSINTLDQPGDPLTPGVAATPDAPRLDIAAVNLPRIPVQPIGYRAAQQIMQRMTGEPLPERLVKTWRGGLPVEYRTGGGQGLRLRLMVQQRREVKRSANVIARLPGASASPRTIYVGSHHDAWGFGAGDPAAGTIVVLEAARTFAALAAQGARPSRSIAFCFWGAEEFGIIGSTEYCEQYAEALRRDAVAYINLDGAAMGPNFSAASDPMLRTLIEECARLVPQARKDGTTVFDAWRADQPQPAFGDLGGGSDHVGWYCHLGVPSCFLSTHGAPGTAYHSNYDNLAWYRRTVGEDYAPALMLTHIVQIMLARLANATIEPLDPAHYASDMRRHIAALAARAQANAIEFDAATLEPALQRLEQACVRWDIARTASSGSTPVNPDHALEINSRIADLARLWQPHWPQGLPGRPWFRNFYASSDPESGYAAWMLPALREAIDDKDPAKVSAARSVYSGILNQLADALESMASIDLARENAGASGR